MSQPHTTVSALGDRGYKEIMVLIETRYCGKSKLVEIYNEWDVDQTDVVTAKAATKKDKGKFLKFTDGSNWYSKIVNVSDEAIKTEAGTIRKDDIAICSKVKWVGGYYSGVPSGEESPLVRQYTRREKEFSTKFINGTLPEKKRLTPRMRLLVLEKMKTQLQTLGCDPEYIVKRMHHWSEGDGMHAYKSTLVLARILGIELEQALPQGGGGPKIGKFMQVINIKEQRRAGALGDGAIQAEYSIEGDDPDREMLGIPTTAQLRELAHGDNKPGSD